MLLEDPEYRDRHQIEKGDPVVAIARVRTETGRTLEPGAKGVVSGMLNMPGLDGRLHSSFEISWSGPHDGLVSLISTRHILKKVQYDPTAYA